MCTCIANRRHAFYFGRNMDIDFHLEQQVIITPRNYPIGFRFVEDLLEHYALIGMGMVVLEYPLYSEAANEHGLCMAGLNFPKNAVYHAVTEGKHNVASFELIPWVLAQCKTVTEAEVLLQKLQIVAVHFNEKITTSPLHWMLSDKERSLVIESTADGLHVYENDFDVMANNPPFPYHREHMRNYMYLSAYPPKNQFSEEIALTTYGEGMGGIGLPGDFSSPSRFVKAAFLNTNAVIDKAEVSGIRECFHIMDAVAMIRGAVGTKKDIWEITAYTCCINATQGIYYYKTYSNNQITAVRLFDHVLENSVLITYDLELIQQINYLEVV